MIALPSFKKRHSGNGNGSAKASDAIPKEPLADARAPVGRHFDAMALEALVERAERALAALQSADATIERGDELAAIGERIDELTTRIEEAQELSARLTILSNRSTEIEAAQSESADQIASAAAELARVTGSFGDLMTKVDAALAISAELDKLPELNAQFSELRNEAGSIRSQMRDLVENVTRLRSVHDDVLRAHKHATIRLEGIDQRQQAVVGKIDLLERRTASADETLQSLLRLTNGVPDVQHQLGVLKATADQVAQRTAALEQQRETIERALEQAEQASALGAQIDTAVRAQETQLRTLSSMDAKLGEIQALQEQVTARGVELEAQQRRLDDAEREAARELATLKEEMRSSAERFEIENRSLDAASERIAELRGFVKDCERRLSVIEETTRVVADTDERARGLASRVDSMGEDVSRISSQAERLRAVRDDVGALDERVSELNERMARIDESRAMVTEVVRELSALSGSREAIRDGMEQLQLAAAELARVRDRQVETNGWLAETDERIRSLRSQVEELERARPTVDALRRDVDRVSGSVAGIEARSAVVDELHERLGALESGVGRLDERSSSVLSRMDAAEARFAELSRQADDAQEVASTISTVTAAVERAERGITSVGASVSALESQAERLDDFGERMQRLAEEIEQRQGALDKATEHLARASEVRREAAEAASRLEELRRELGEQLVQLEARGDALAELATTLDGRAEVLHDVDERVTTLEELLAQWQAAHAATTTALEQIAGRQAAVDAVQGQLRHLFEVAERTSTDVRSITAARREVEETRAVLDETQERLGRFNSTMRDFTERKRQIEEIEQRLARADALTRDVQSTLEMISAQRSIVDQVLQRSGTLAIQAKQAEGLIEALRAECALATTLQGAVQQVRSVRDIGTA